MFAKLLETKSYLNANNYDSIIKFSEYVSADSSINGRKITVEEKQLVWDYLNKKGYPANKRRLLKDTLNRYINNDITDIDFVIEENKSLKLSK